MEQERRQWARIRPPQLVYVELGADNGGMVRDISEAGIGFCAVSAVIGGEKIPFVFTPDGERRLQGNAESAWTDETGKVGGLRFLEVSDEFRGKLHSWLRGNTVTAGSLAQHGPDAATPMDWMEQPPREPLRELPKSTSEGQSKILKANAMRMAVDALAPPEQEEPARKNPPDTLVVLDEVSEISSPGVMSWLTKPALSDEAREVPPRDKGNVWRAAGALFVVMLLVILFLFRQEAGDGLIWLGKKIAGEPRAVPLQQSDGQLRTPAPMADPSKGASQNRPESGGANKSVLAPLPPTVPGPTVAPTRTSPPSDTGQFPSGTQRTIKKRYSEPGSHPEATQQKVVTENGAETVELLWAKVTKGEVSAEIALADLYVQGERVPKNCAQARVLLSAAAKKGNQIAARKLIDLDRADRGCSTSAPH